jgi:hypothetical protein
MSQGKDYYSIFYLLYHQRPVDTITTILTSGFRLVEIVKTKSEGYSESMEFGILDHLSVYFIL